MKNLYENGEKNLYFLKLRMVIPYGVKNPYLYG